MLIPVALTVPAVVAPAPQLKVSANQRYLVQEDGRPFFWLGDTAWELFHRLDREQADRYLADRARKGFTVIQAVALAELDGHNVPNAYGHLPFVDGDPTKPAADYWKHVDWIVENANKRGLVVGLLPTWGRYWHDGDRPLFNPANAETYGKWLGQRYRNHRLVWILGGDRKVENDTQRETIRAMARGLREGDGGAHLRTFHPYGGGSSAETFHEEPWLDFNMRQSGHGIEANGRVEGMAADYARTPVKPVVDGEPIYEDHPVSFDPDHLGHSTAADVRRALYWDLFAGAFGHTYGNHAIWQMAMPGKEGINRPLTDWTTALDAPGAGQMQHGRRLMESRPFLTRVPDDSLIVPSAFPSSVPGRGTRRFVATRDSEGSYAMVYVPLGRPFDVRLDRIHGPKARAWWFDPRTGKATRIGDFPTTGTHTFTPPTPGELLDWILVLDDATRNFPTPGTIK